MTKPPRTQTKNQTPSVVTRAQGVEFFNSPLGALAVGMEPSSAFASLTPTARAFVLALIESGGGNLTRAAMAAGYTGTNGSLQVTASRLAADPRVQQSLMDIAMGLARSSSLLAIVELVKMVSSPTLKEQTKLVAISKLVSLIGMEPEKRVHVQHSGEVQITTQQQVAEVVRMAREIGVDPRKLLGKAGITVDAEFEIVGTNEGLEDLL